MGAWDALTLPASAVHAVSMADFRKVRDTIPADHELLISGKNRVRTILRGKLAIYVARQGDETFFDNIAGAASLADGLQSALAYGYGCAYYEDKYAGDTDQWYLRFENCTKMLKMECDSLAQIAAVALGLTDTAPQATDLSYGVTGISSGGFTKLNGY